MLAANTEGKALIEDFEKLLSSNTYTEPLLAEEAVNMLAAVLNVAMKLAGGKLCIALMGYVYADKLMRLHDRPITVNKERVKRFLVKLLHKIDIKVQIVFNAIFDQVCNVQTVAFIIDGSIMDTLLIKICHRLCFVVN